LFCGFDLKVYFKNIHPKFPEGGKMSQHLESLNIGDTVQIKGPVGRIYYKGCGEFSIRRELKASSPYNPYKFKQLGMIAGGSGITPIYQLLQAITSNPEDKTTMSLIYANQSEDDILVREHIEKLAAEFPDKVKFWYTVDRAQPGWKYSTGYINEDMIREHLPAAGPDTGIFMCGPPPMIKMACIPALEKVGHTENNYFSF
jgi:cytochrome-b5 reductase